MQRVGPATALVVDAAVATPKVVDGAPVLEALLRKLLVFDILPLQTMYQRENFGKFALQILASFDLDHRQVKMARNALIILLLVNDDVRALEEVVR